MKQQKRAGTPMKVANGEVTVDHRDNGKGGYDWYVESHFCTSGMDEREAWAMADKQVELANS